MQIAQDVEWATIEESIEIKSKSGQEAIFHRCLLGHDATKHIKANEGQILSVQDKSRNRQHHQQRSRLFLIEYGFSTFLLYSRSKLQFATIQSAGHRCLYRQK